MKKLFQKFNIKRLNKLRLKNKACVQYCVKMLVNFIYSKINILFYILIDKLQCTHLNAYIITLMHVFFSNCSKCSKQNLNDKH